MQFVSESCTKCGVVTFGESKAPHFQYMNEREWKLGSNIVGEVYGYKNLGILKNYINDSNTEKLCWQTTLKKKLGKRQIN